MVSFVVGLLVAILVLVSLYPARREVFIFDGAMRRARLLLLLTSLALVYLGVAAVSIPDQPAIWGIAGGVADGGPGHVLDLFRVTISTAAPATTSNVTAQPITTRTPR